MRFCRYILTVAALALLASPGLAAPARAEDGSGAYIPAEVLVRVAPGVDVSAVARDHGLAGGAGGIEQLAGLPVYRLRVVDAVTPPRKVERLKGDRRVVYAELNSIGAIPWARQRSSWTVGSSDGSAAFASQWATERMGLTAAQAVTRGEGVTIALLDTGVDVAHPALAGRLLAGYDFVDGDGDPREGGAYGGAYGHGTAVAGMLALAAPGAMILPLRTLDEDGSGTIWSQARALRYAAGAGADVISLSFSFRTPSLVLNDVLADLTCVTLASADCRSRVRPGIVVVAAAGNSGASVAEYPAASGLPGVMAVAASTEQDLLAEFSTYGPWVRVGAPGVAVMSTVPGGGYGSWSGTSMSAPLVAGVAALVRTASPAYQPAQVVAHIVATSAELSGPVRRRVDARAALCGRLSRQ